MAGLSRKLSSSVSIKVAEAAAILNGLHLAIESRFTRLLVESDALNVINCLSLNHPPRSEFGLIVADIWSLCSHVDVVFSYVPSGANWVAHLLARHSFTIDNVSIWLEDALDWLNQSLLADIRS
ncbi:hypothetical protein ACOSP7_010194 [Xanthoceras sorbifolium]